MSKRKRHSRPFPYFWTLLRYEIILFFHHLKKENKELFELSSEKKPGEVPMFLGFV